MLNVLRENFREKPYLRIVLGIVAVALVLSLGYYFSGTGGGSAPSDWVARVNGSEIPGWRFREVASNLDEYYRGLFGENYEQIKPQLGIRRQAIESLIDTELVLQDARRLGLRSSPADLAERIRTHPSLQDENGQFIGKDRYKRVLERNYPGGTAAFERLLSQSLIEAKWASLVTQPVVVPENELEEIFRKRTEKTAIDYVLVTSTDREVDEDVSDDELRRWYDEHQEDYMRDAGRQVRYVVVERESQLEKIEIPAEEIQRHYDENQSAYTYPEQRRARHILFRVDAGASDEEKDAARARAEDALAQLQGGADFDALARELSDDTVSAERGGDLDFFGRGQMVEAFEQAAFDTPVGQLAPITESTFGFHVIEVTDSREAGLAPLEEVESQILRLIRLRRVDDRLVREAERMRGEMGTADGLDEVAAREGLEVASAFFSEGRPIPGLGASPEFDQTVAALEPGTISSPLRVVAGMALVVVDEILPAAPAPFDEVRSAVTIALLNDRRRADALRAAEKALEQNDDLAAAAEALGQEVKESGDLGPGQPLPGSGGSTDEFEQALFADTVAEGDRGIVEVPDGVVIFQITRREPFDPERFENEKVQLRNETLLDRRERYRQGILFRLKQSQTVEYNPVWLEQLEG